MDSSLSKYKLERKMRKQKSLKKLKRRGVGGQNTQSPLSFFLFIQFQYIHSSIVFLYSVQCFVNEVLKFRYFTVLVIHTLLLQEAFQVLLNLLRLALFAFFTLTLTLTLMLMFYMHVGSQRKEAKRGEAERRNVEEKK